MSLGTTIPPSGESGTVGALEHLPDQLPDNPATLKANTSIETISQVMYDNWIWRNNFTVDPSMRPGHIFGLIKIHPRNCNQYISHISRMFLTWTGSMKIRSRFMATFQFGGSVRIGFLPPRFTESEVRNLPITTLTAYPNVDLDPKNTGWTHFQASDERNVLFHWMRDLSDDEAAAFSGWFTFYIASPIVLSGGVASQVQMLVESAGAFNFSQLSPIDDIIPDTPSWLKESALNIFEQFGCDDECSNATTGFQILASSVVSLPVGFVRAYGKGKLTHLITPGTTMSLAQTGLASVPDHTVTSSFLAATTNVGTATECTTVWNNDSSRFPILNCVYTSWTFGNPRAKGGVVTATIPDAFVDAANPEYKGTVTGDFTGITQADGHFTVSQRANPPFSLPSFGFPGSLPNLVPAESIVTFINVEQQTLNLQTSAMARAMKAEAFTDLTTSQIFLLHAEGTSGPIMQLRLSPTGMFTTNAVSADTLLLAVTQTGRCRLEYLQDLPMSSPLPPSSFSKRNLSKFFMATKYNYSAQRIRDEIIPSL